MTEKKDKQDNKKEYKEFRELLRKGIGLRTQSDFAEAVGITRQHLNRLLNETMIYRPSQDTLKSMAKNMAGVSYKELLIACDYPTLSIEELADILAIDLDSFFMDREHNAATPVMHGPLSELCDTFEMLYSPEDVEQKMTFIIKEAQDNTNKNYPDADKTTRIEMLWGDYEYSCKTTFNLYYILAKSGGMVMLGCEVEKTADGESAVIKKRGAKNNMGSAEQRLLAAIFGTYSGTYYPTFETGYGFPYDETPTKFKEFLSNHRAAFCINEERSTLWRRVVVDNEDPDTVFNGFTTIEGEGTGTGAVVATIMSDELKDQPCMDGDRFTFCDKDENLPEDERDSFIMTIKEECSPERRKTLMPYIYFYAHELGISHFGRCYHRFMMELELNEWHNTEEYGARIR